MPRRLTSFLPQEIYHIYNRGNNRQTVFFGPDNYVYFLRGIKKYLIKEVSILAYCLMPTHYHLLLQIRDTDKDDSGQKLSQAMQKLSISYTKAINKRFERVGALFQGQFQAKHVSTTNHLHQLCYYIHANPVKDGLVESPEDWLYSNYHEWVGLRNGSLFDTSFLEEHFGTKDFYKESVQSYLQTQSISDQLPSYLQD